ncbi:MAG: VOC family protein [Thermoanaerobaculales bacterium]|nr:VOC family protein [Thermoanaerobaculales bacterium]
MSSEKRGRFVWYDLMTDDPKAAQDFYTQLIGWGTQEWEGGEQPYTMWTNKETPLGGVMELPEEAKAAGAPPHRTAYVSVKDVNESVAKVAELGGQVLNGPMEVPGGDLIAQCVDPQGALFALHSKA